MLPKRRGYTMTKNEIKKFLDKLEVGQNQYIVDGVY